MHPSVESRGRSHPTLGAHDVVDLLELTVEQRLGEKQDCARPRFCPSPGDGGGRGRELTAVCLYGCLLRAVAVVAGANPRTDVLENTRIDADAPPCAKGPGGPTFNQSGEVGQSGANALIRQERTRICRISAGTESGV